MHNTINHYDSLIDENNDPVRDVQVLRDYMDKWDGVVFIDLMELDKTKTALEIGVGSGRIAVKTIPLIKHFTGIDISPKTIERAKENLAEFENQILICDDFLIHKFDKQFDVIYSSLTFFHIKEKQSALHKIASLLKTGGRFILSISKDQATELNYGLCKIPLYPDTPEELKFLMTDAKLKVLETVETEFAWIIVAGLC